MKVELSNEELSQAIKNYLANIFKYKIKDIKIQGDERVVCDITLGSEENKESVETTEKTKGKRTSKKEEEKEEEEYHWKEPELPQLRRAHPSEIKKLSPEETKLYYEFVVAVCKFNEIENKIRAKEIFDSATGQLAYVISQYAPYPYLLGEHKKHVERGECKYYEDEWAEMQAALKEKPKEVEKPVEPVKEPEKKKELTGIDEIWEAQQKARAAAALANASNPTNNTQPLNIPNEPTKKTQSLDFSDDEIEPVNEVRKGTISLDFDDDVVEPIKPVEQKTSGTVSIDFDELYRKEQEEKKKKAEEEAAKQEPERRPLFTFNSAVKKTGSIFTTSK